MDKMVIWISTSGSSKGSTEAALIVAILIIALFSNLE